ncbi:MAG: hypothetical protein ACOCXG_00350 [Nanoarchaeota archaeon]
MENSLVGTRFIGKRAEERAEHFIQSKPIYFYKKFDREGISGYEIFLKE